MALAPGTRLGAYEIHSLIGAGGMGEVYRARDTRLGRDVAIKILPASFSADPDRLSRFEQEARASAALNHPGILAVYDIGTEGAAPYIVSELLEGQSLRERLASGPLPPRKAVELAVQIARGLAAAHEKGIVHRDLKPENLFVTVDGRAKILDFGLAKLTQPSTHVSNATSVPTTPKFETQSGMMLGTLGYMAPEQVRAQTVDHRADIFAFGAILYEMLSGRRAFQGETTPDTMTAILKEDPPELQSGDKQIPPALARIVDRCLEKSPAGRFQSTRDLAFALEGVSSHSASIKVVADESPRRLRMPLAWVIAGMATVVALALIPIAVRHLSETAPIDKVIRFTVSPPAEGLFITPGGGGQNYAPAQTVSPDGRYLAFVGRAGSGPIQLWVRALDAIHARPLSGTNDANFPFWSPDSRFIAFFADGKIKKVDVSGGPPQTLGDAGQGEGGSWNGDGTILLGAIGGGIRKVPASGGDVTAVTAPDASKDVSHRYPQFLPDGRHFLFISLPSNEARVGSLDSPETKTLLTADSKAMYSPPGYLLFVRGRSLLAQPFDPDRMELSGNPLPIAEDVRVNAQQGRAAFSVSDGGILTFRGGGVGGSLMAWFDRSGRQLEIIGEAARYRDLELSPDGRHAAVALTALEGASRPDVWIVDLERRVPVRLTVDPGGEESPVWSPDGNTVIFSSYRKDRFDLYMKPTSGIVGDERLYGSDRNTFAYDWSSDGKYVLFGDQSKTNSELGRQLLDGDIWALPLAGDRKPVPVATTQFIEFHATFSPDGRWVAFHSNESGRSELYVKQFLGAATKYRISPSGASFGTPRWRKDGKELFYVGPDRMLMAVEINGESDTLKIGTPRPLFQLAIGFSARSYDVSADGQRFLVITSPQDPFDPLTVVVNWAANLTKKD